MGKAEDQTLEVYVIRGRINSLEENVGIADGEVAKAEAIVKEAEQALQNFVDEKELAEAGAQEAEQIVAQKVEAVKAAQNALAKAKEYLADRESHAANYTIEEKKVLDIACSESIDGREKAQVARNAIVNKLEDTKKQLGIKLEALRDEGIILSFEAPRAPKTHYL